MFIGEEWKERKVTMFKDSFLRFQIEYKGDFLFMLKNILVKVKIIKCFFYI